VFSVASMEGSGMHPDRWRQISEVYHAALTRDPRDRSRRAPAMTRCTGKWHRC
jgi:hypothetical protein